MTDSVAGLPYATIGVPGRDLGLQLLLDKDADGTGVVLVLPYRVTGTDADGQPDRATASRRWTCTWRDEGVAGPRPVHRPARLRRVHPAHRQARSGPGPRLAGLRPAHRRDHHHVLPAAPARLDPARPRRPAGDRLAVRSLRRRRARVRAPARPARGRPPSGLTRAVARARAPSSGMHNPGSYLSILNRNPVRWYAPGDSPRTRVPSTRIVQQRHTASGDP